MAETIVSPARGLSGAVRLAGDKSISHRYAILGAIAEGASRLENYSAGADCRSTLECLRALGVGIAISDEAVEIQGVGLHGFSAPAAPLDCGNSGSTMRMLAGVLAAQAFPSQLIGDDSLSRRPMARILEPLGRMGAVIAARDSRAPLSFSPPPGGLSGIEYRPTVASAQVKTALLLAALYARGTTTVFEPVPTRDHTEIALQRLGVRLARDRTGITVRGPVASLPAAGTFRIPGDPSSAAFFLCAAAMFPEANLLVDDVSLNPSRAALLDLLSGLGADLRILSMEDRGGELAGTLQAGGLKADAVGRRRSRLLGTTVEGSLAAALIDEIPVLAVLATTTEQGIDFRDVAELRVKESDRIAAIAANLRAMGAHCSERTDGLFVPGGQRLRGARIDSRGDHRIAMAFAVAALIADGESVIEGSECAGISFPDFFDTLDRLADR